MTAVVTSPSSQFPSHRAPEPNSQQLPASMKLSDTIQVKCPKQNPDIPFSIYFLLQSYSSLSTVTVPTVTEAENWKVIFHPSFSHPSPHPKQILYLLVFLQGHYEYYSNPPSPPHPLNSHCIFTVFIVLPFPEYPINGIMQYVAFAEGLILLWSRYLRFIPVSVLLDAHSFLLLNSIPLCGCSILCLFIHLLKDIVTVSSSAAAAAAKSLQSCLTLCDPIDGSPPGSPVPGILQARTLEWVAISFSNV